MDQQETQFHHACRGGMHGRGCSESPKSCFRTSAIPRERRSRLRPAADAPFPTILRASTAGTHHAWRWAVAFALDPTKASRNNRAISLRMVPPPEEAPTKQSPEDGGTVGVPVVLARLVRSIRGTPLQQSRDRRERVARPRPRRGLRGRLAERRVDPAVTPVHVRAAETMTASVTGNLRPGQPHSAPRIWTSA